MKLIDTHSHQYADVFLEDRNEAADRARNTCSHVLLPNIDMASIDPMLSLCKDFPDLYLPMMGLHPCYVKDDHEVVIAEIERQLKSGKWIGIGETGLDYYWDTSKVKEQKASLSLHINWAKDMGLPLILHCRNSLDDVIEMVKEGQNGDLKGIFHCFDGTLDQSKEIRDLGFKLGIGGVLTYKKSPLKEVISGIPLESIVLETDSPYLPPTPYRGKRNESSYVQLVADKLVDLCGYSATQVAETTSNNARELFGLQD